MSNRSAEKRCKTCGEPLEVGDDCGRHVYRPSKQSCSHPVIEQYPRGSGQYQCEVCLEPFSVRLADETDSGAQVARKTDTRQSGETDADSVDAARYRFLRQPGNAIVYAKDRKAWGEGASGHVRYETAEQLDAAVDTARDAEKTPDDALCHECGHSFGQHSKGPVNDLYCRHCPCPQWQSSQRSL